MQRQLSSIIPSSTPELLISDRSSYFNACWTGPSEVIKVLKLLVILGCNTTAFNMAPFIAYITAYSSMTFMDLLLAYRAAIGVRSRRTRIEWPHLH